MKSDKLILCVALFAMAAPAQSTPARGKGGRGSRKPETCSVAASEIGRNAIDILYVEALSTQPTDGTYADEGYGQGEFDTVKLLGVLKSPLRWEIGHVFWVHPFSGKRSEREDLAPEHLIPGKRYYLVYSYYLDQEPRGEAQLIGLTRCGVFDVTRAVRAQLMATRGISRPAANK